MEQQAESTSCIQNLVDVTRTDTITREQLFGEERLAGIVMEVNEVPNFYVRKPFVKCEYCLRDMNPIVNRGDFLPAHIHWKKMVGKYRARHVEIAGDFTMHELNILTYLCRCDCDLMYIQEYLEGKPLTVRKLVKL